MEEGLGEIQERKCRIRDLGIIFLKKISLGYLELREDFTQSRDYQK
jgi:hypothetical protein